MANVALTGARDFTARVRVERMVGRRIVTQHAGHNAEQAQLLVDESSDLSQMFGITALEYPEMNVFLFPPGSS
jgi:hypothetical protein